MNKIVPFSIPMTLLLMPYIVFGFEINNVQSLGIALVYFINTLIIPFLFSLALLIFIFFVVRYFIFEIGNSEGREKAKRYALYSISAFIVMVSLWGIVNLIVSGLGFGRSEPLCVDYPGMQNCATSNRFTGTGTGGGFTFLGVSVGGQFNAPGYCRFFSWIAGCSSTPAPANSVAPATNSPAPSAPPPPAAPSSPATTGTKPVASNQTVLTTADIYQRAEQTLNQTIKEYLSATDDTLTPEEIDRRAKDLMSTFSNLSDAQKVDRLKQFKNNYYYIDDKVYNEVLDALNKLRVERGEKPLN